MNREIRRRQSRSARLERNTGSRTKEPDTTLKFLTGRRLIIAAIVLVIAGAVAYGAFALRGGGDVAGVQTLADQGHAHLPASGDTNDQYNSNPPTSGTHDPVPAAWGVYAEGQSGPCGTNPTLGCFPSKEQLVHNMEHGGVVVWYKPSALSADQVDQLTRAAIGWLKDDKDKVVVYPFEGMDHAIALTAWTKLLTLDSLNIDTVGQFVGNYQNISEAGQEAVGSVTSPIVLPPGYQ